MIEKIVIFDVGIRSYNKGDEIISRSAMNEINALLRNRFVIRCGTHSPAITFYQNSRRNPELAYYDNAKYKFVCGSNLLWKNLFCPRPSWNINPFNAKPYSESILLGVGTGNSADKINFYTRYIYNRVLSKKYIHSVRDENTAIFLRSLGFRAIDTGCPTMWGFTDEFCSSIPIKKLIK